MYKRNTLGISSPIRYDSRRSITPEHVSNQNDISDIKKTYNNYVISMSYKLLVNNFYGFRPI